MTKTKIQKILIANRGEIAVRIIRTCQEMGIQTVLIYSDADKNSLAYQMADKVCALNGVSSQETYLNISKILDIAKKEQVCAIHPGYGFLSEKADFAQAVLDAGFVFIGPSPKAILQMGDKVVARQLAKKANLPMIEGTLEPLTDANAGKEFAKKVGYPVLIKAASGGGGKGMRVVENEQDFDSLFALAKSEALNSFSDERVYIEKYIKNPKHIEAQIVRDSYGKTLFLWERECSLQRRHQKIIEEAPCFYLKDEVSKKMAKC